MHAAFGTVHNTSGVCTKGLTHTRLEVERMFLLEEDQVCYVLISLFANTYFLYVAVCVHLLKEKWNDDKYVRESVGLSEPKRWCVQECAREGEREKRCV